LSKSLPDIIGIIWEIGETDFSIIIEAKVDDLLIFEFTTNHDVHLMTFEEYTNCQFNSNNNLGDNSPVFYNIPKTAKGRTLYFGCSVGTHCSRFNMKIQVVVQE